MSKGKMWFVAKRSASLLNFGFYTACMNITEAINSYPNLALERLGAKVVACSDEFFAPAKRIIKQERPIFIDGKYDDSGKWMDGWETRRRRTKKPDHDWLELTLGSPCVAKAINICTTHFDGNQPSQAVVEALPPGARKNKWFPIVERSDLAANSDNWFEPKSQEPLQLFRLKIYPDGGVARLRIHGGFVCGMTTGDKADLACVLSGARVASYSDAHFGKPENMLMPDKGINMGDGWETARRRGEGHDWAIVELGCPGIVEKIIVDTSHFKGNYPERCDIQAALVPANTKTGELVALSEGWKQILASKKLKPDHKHQFKAKAKEPISHLRLNIHPDGGICRLRVIGKARP